MTNKPFAGEWTECHNPDCRAGFTRDTETRHHCSEECAAACLRRRIGSAGPYGRLAPASETAAETVTTEA